MPAREKNYEFLLLCFSLGITALSQCESPLLISPAQPKDLYFEMHQISPAKALHTVASLKDWKETNRIGLIKVCNKQTWQQAFLFHYFVCRNIPVFLHWTSLKEASFQHGKVFCVGMYPLKSKLRLYICYLPLTYLRSAEGKAWKMNFACCSLPLLKHFCSEYVGL